MCTVYFRFVQRHAFFAYRLAFSAITRNIATLNLLHTKIFNLSGFQKCAKFYTHEKFYVYSSMNVMGEGLATQHVYVILSVISF